MDMTSSGAVAAAVFAFAALCATSASAYCPPMAINCDGSLSQASSEPRRILDVQGAWAIKTGGASQAENNLRLPMNVREFTHESQSGRLDIDARRNTCTDDICLDNATKVKGRFRSRNARRLQTETVFNGRRPFASFTQMRTHGGINAKVHSDH